MNKWLKIIGTFGIVALVSAALAGAVAFAQSDGGDFGLRRGFGERGFERAGFEGRGFEGEGPHRGGPRGPKGLGGEVTAIDTEDGSLTVDTRRGDSVTVSVSDETRVMVAETQSEGSLADIEVGDNVKLMGRPAEEGEQVEARGILLLPAGDMAGGRVTAIDGETITVEPPREDGPTTIVTDGETRFMLGRDGGEGSLADVSEAKGVMAFGDTQDDGSLAANVVLVHDGPAHDGPGHGPRGPKGLGGEVTAIGDDTLTVDTRRGDSVSVSVSDETRVMVAETQSEGSLADIEVGDNVKLMGRPAEEGEQVETRGILLLPAGDMAGGRVTAIDGETITVEPPREDGPTTIVTDGETRFMLGRDGGEGSLADVSGAKGVMAFGDTQEDGSLAANVVLVHDGPAHGGPGHGGPAHGGSGHGPREGRVGGEVTGIEGSSFTIEPFRGEADSLTILTDGETEYRTRREADVTFDDIAEGGHVMVKGQPVEGQENRIQAEVVGIKIDE